MEAINPNQKFFWQIALVVSIVIAAAGFLVDFRYTQKYGGIDLRDRVVGARVASELDQNPFFFKWTNGQSDRFLDPLDNQAVPVYSRLTVTPAVLSLHSLFSALPYKGQQYFWFTVQWVALLGSIYLLTKILSPDPTQKKAIWILGLLGISGSFFWRLHVERGQIYIVYVFLFCLAFYLYKKYEQKNNQLQFNSLFISSGLILGYLISLRPPYLFAIIPFIIYKKIKFTAVIITGMVASILLSSLLSSNPLWPSYYRSIQLQTSLTISENTPHEPYHQAIVEGINLKEFLSVPGEDSSLFRIFRGIFNQWFSSSTFLILLLGFLAITSLGILKYKIPEISSSQLFFLGIALTFFSEFFIAAARWPYANVIWLIPLSIMITEARKISTGHLVYFASGLAFLGLAANVGFHLIPHFTFVGDAAIPISVLLFTLAFLQQNSPPKHISPAQS